MMRWSRVLKREGREVARNTRKEDDEGCVDIPRVVSRQIIGPDGWRSPEAPKIMGRLRSSLIPHT
jgi:hypothetical protein